MQANRTGNSIFRVNQSEKCKTQLRPLPVKRQGSYCQREEERRREKKTDEKMLSADRSRNKKKEEKIHGTAICTR